jgi:succinate-acetate transporter protein
MTTSDAVGQQSAQDRQVQAAAPPRMADPAAWAVTAFATTSFMLGMYQSGLLNSAGIPIVLPGAGAGLGNVTKAGGWVVLVFAVLAWYHAAGDVIAATFGRKVLPVGPPPVRVALAGPARHSHPRRRAGLRPRRPASARPGRHG